MVSSLGEIEETLRSNSALSTGPRGRPNLACPPNQLDGGPDLLALGGGIANHALQVRAARGSVAGRSRNGD